MARRISLREFQQDLVRRLNEAAASEAPSTRLGVQIGGELWLVRLEEAGEVIPLPPFVAVPLTRPWFRGLANIRGNLFSVVDLSAFHGGDPTPGRDPSGRHRRVVTRASASPRRRGAPRPRRPRPATAASASSRR